MSIVNEIKYPVKKEMEAFEKAFSVSMKSNNRLLDVIVKYLLKRKGKRIRPLLVFLTAKLINEKDISSDTTMRAAVLIELLHTATLVHDDVVDNSYQRRGFFSLNALWKNKISVLIGDFLLAKGLLLAVDHKEYELLQIVSRATKEMSEGELMQMENARKLEVDEEKYFSVIRKKTASFIAACCELGAYSAKANEEIIEKMSLFGEYIGIAFQIKDDLFDYENNKNTGKSNGTDIKESMMTLPLIHILKTIPHSEKRSLIRKIKRKNNTQSDLLDIIATVKKYGGIAYAKKIMNEYKDKAMAILDEFEDCTYKTSLKKLVIYTVERTK